MNSFIGLRGCLSQPAWQKAVFVINTCTNGLPVSHLSLSYRDSLLQIRWLWWPTATQWAAAVVPAPGLSSVLGELHSKEAFLLC